MKDLTCTKHIFINDAELRDKLNVIILLHRIFKKISLTELQSLSIAEMKNLKLIELLGINSFMFKFVEDPKEDISFLNYDSGNSMIIVGETITLYTALYFSFKELIYQ